MTATLDALKAEEADLKKRLKEVQRKAKQEERDKNADDLLAKWIKINEIRNAYMSALAQSGFTEEEANQCPVIYKYKAARGAGSSNDADAEWVKKALGNGATLDDLENNAKRHYEKKAMLASTKKRRSKTGDGKKSEKTKQKSQASANKGSSTRTDGGLTRDQVRSSV